MGQCSVVAGFLRKQASGGSRWRSPDRMPTARCKVRWAGWLEAWRVTRLYVLRSTDGSGIGPRLPLVRAALRRPQITKVTKPWVY